MGRWLSPDWSTSPEPLPYADKADPQSLNLYGYVRDNPVWRSDVDGHGFFHKLWNAITDGGWTDDDKQAAATRHQRRVDRARFYANQFAKQCKCDFDPSRYSDSQILNAFNNGDFSKSGNDPLDPLRLLGIVTVVPVPGPEVPVRDTTGKVHTDLPDHVPDNWTKEDLETAKDELRESINRRSQEQAQKGEDPGHRERIRREEQLLRQVEKKLSGS
jgi:hypothetical protein